MRGECQSGEVRVGVEAVPSHGYRSRHSRSRTPFVTGEIPHIILSVISTVLVRL